MINLFYYFFFSWLYKVVVLHKADCCRPPSSCGRSFLCALPTVLLSLILSHRIWTRCPQCCEFGSGTWIPFRSWSACPKCGTQRRSRSHHRARRLCFIWTMSWSQMSCQRTLRRSMSVLWTQLRRSRSGTIRSQPSSVCALSCCFVFGYIWKRLTCSSLFALDCSPGNQWSEGEPGSGVALTRDSALSGSLQPVSHWNSVFDWTAHWIEQALWGSPCGGDHWHKHNHRRRGSVFPPSGLQHLITQGSDKRYYFM